MMTRAEAAALMHQQQLKCGIKPPASAVAAREPTPRRGRLNGLERAYACVLEARKSTGEVLWYGFEAVKLRLAEGAWFCADFTVILGSGEMEFHEVKGSFWREAARVRIKVAAETFPHWRFRAVQRKHEGGWQHEIFGITPAPLAKEAT